MSAANTANQVLVWTSLAINSANSIAKTSRNEEVQKVVGDIADMAIPILNALHGLRTNIIEIMAEGDYAIEDLVRLANEAIVVEDGLLDALRDKMDETEEEESNG